MLTGMPSTVTAKSVPWSRLNPRRKYWLALPSPECCVATTPGTASTMSPGRSLGRSRKACRSTAPSLALSATPIAASRGPWTWTSGRWPGASDCAQAAGPRSRHHATECGRSVARKAGGTTGGMGWTGEGGRGTAVPGSEAGRAGRSVQYGAATLADSARAGRGLRSAARHRSAPLGSRPARRVPAGECFLEHRIARPVAVRKQQPRGGRGGHIG